MAGSTVKLGGRYRGQYMSVEILRPQPFGLRLITAGFQDFARAMEKVAADIAKIARRWPSPLDRALSLSSDELLARRAFIADGGDLDSILQIEELFGVGA